MVTISISVGRDGLNRRQDVITIQTLLNQQMHVLAPLRPLQVDGVMGPRTIAAIEAFQRCVLHMQWPDGRVDPLGQTLKKLAATPHAGTPSTSSHPPLLNDPAIEALHLGPTAKQAAYALKQAHPTIVFTSGRRDKADQARAMAGNVVANKQWIQQTYLDTKGLWGINIRNSLNLLRFSV
jgi:hypothetical protein